LPSDTTGVVIIEIASDSPVYNHLQVNEIIVELQKTKINNLNQLEDILKKNLIYMKSTFFKYESSKYFSDG